MQKMYGLKKGNRFEAFFVKKSPNNFITVWKMSYFCLIILSFKICVLYVCICNCIARGVVYSLLELDYEEDYDK